MKQRIALATAAALTAFVLVLVGGLASRLSSATPAAPATAATVAAPTAAALDPTVQAAIAERDAAYQQALAEANARIEAANAQVRAANAQLEQASVQPVVAAPVAPAALAPPSYSVSAEQALVIAQGAAYGATASKAAELVSLQGAPAYEVTFAQGLVYVDANSGAVLANSLPALAPAQRYDDEHEEHEHEEHEHEEHEGGDHD